MHGVYTAHELVLRENETDENTDSASARVQMILGVRKRLIYGCYQNVLQKAFFVLRDVREPTINGISMGPRLSRSKGLGLTDT